MYSPPADGSCFYHSFSYMVKPLLQAETLSPKALKEMAKVFYNTCSGTLKENLERSLGATYLVLHGQTVHIKHLHFVL